jgi:hypothetical protein
MERMLIELKVRHFLLPAAEEAESIWTKKFGFSRISSDQVSFVKFSKSSFIGQPVCADKPFSL